MELHFLVTEDESSGWLVASALGHGIVTQAENETDLKIAIRDAIQCHFDEGMAPAIVRLHFSKEETLSFV